VTVDFAIHSPHGKTDIRNHHAQIMMTTRKVGPDGLGKKSELELENKKLQALGLPTSHEQLRDIRIGWEQRTNEHLARDRGMFDGLNLSTARGRPEAERPARECPTRERVPEPAQLDAPDGLNRAVDRYARAWTDATRMREQDLLVLEHQKLALRDAGTAL